MGPCMFQHPLTILRDHSLATRYKFSRQTRDENEDLIIIVLFIEK